MIIMRILKIILKYDYNEYIQLNILDSMKNINKN